MWMILFGQSEPSRFVADCLIDCLIRFRLSPSLSSAAPPGSLSDESGQRMAVTAQGRGAELSTIPGVPVSAFAKTSRVLPQLRLCFPLPLAACGARLRQEAARQRLRRLFWRQPPELSKHLDSRSRNAFDVLSKGGEETGDV